MGWWMPLSDSGKCLIFLKLGSHQPQNCASYEPVCEDHWVSLFGFVLLTEVFAVLQAVHASGKRSRNNSVRTQCLLSIIPQSCHFRFESAWPPKDLGVWVGKFIFVWKGWDCDSCISTLLCALSERYSVLSLISSTCGFFTGVFFFPFSVDLRNWPKVVKRIWRSYSLHGHKGWILQAITLRKEPLKW